MMTVEVEVLGHREKNVLIVRVTVYERLYDSPDSRVPMR